MMLVDAGPVDGEVTIIGVEELGLYVVVMFVDTVVVLVAEGVVVVLGGMTGMLVVEGAVVAKGGVSDVLAARFNFADCVSASLLVLAFLTMVEGVTDTGKEFFFDVVSIALSCGLVLSLISSNLVLEIVVVVVVVVVAVVVVVLELVEGVAVIVGVALRLCLVPFSFACVIISGICMMSYPSNS